MNEFTNRDGGMLLTKQPYKNGFVLVSIDFPSDGHAMFLGFRVIKKSDNQYSNMAIAKELHTKMTGGKFRKKLIRTMFARHLNRNARRLVANEKKQKENDSV
jgi:hypothetical protein